MNVVYRVSSLVTDAIAEFLHKSALLFDTCCLHCTHGHFRNLLACFTYFNNLTHPFYTLSDIPAVIQVIYTELLFINAAYIIFISDRNILSAYNNNHMA